jgi:recombination protein RecA
VRAKVVKNKIAPPFRLTEFDILFSQGISREGDLIDLAAHCGVIAKQGAWYSHGKTRLGQGRERVRTFLLENPDLVETLTKEVNLSLGLEPPATDDDKTTEALPKARAK